MRTKLVIGSILVLALLLLMPSIPALQHKIVRDEILYEIPEELDFKNIIELYEFGKLDREKHPILRLLITAWMYFRLIRCQVFAELSYDINYEYDYDFEIYHPILFLRLLMLLINTGLIITFSEGLSNIFGWNWNIPN